VTTTLPKPDSGRFFRLLERHNRFKTRISERRSMPRADSSMKLEAKKLLFDVIKACGDAEQ